MNLLMTVGKKQGRVAIEGVGASDGARLHPGDLLLDGGQLAFIVVEVLRRGRKLDVRVEEAITSLAFLVLGLVSVNAAIGDVWTNLLSLK